MTRREAEEEILLLVQEMERSTFVHDEAVVRAARSAFDTLKRLPEGAPWDAQVALIQRLHGSISRPAGAFMALGYFAVGLLITSPLWWKAGR